MDNQNRRMVNKKLETLLSMLLMGGFIVQHEQKLNNGFQSM